MKNVRHAYFSVWLIGLSFIVHQTVFAHGGGVLYATSEPVGNYTVSVWVNPPEPRENEAIHFTVGIAGENQEPILDAAVMIDIYAPGEANPIISAAATTEQSVNRLFYEADIPEVNVGSYDVQVVIHAQENSGTVSFAVTILPPNYSRWLLMGAISIILIGGGTFYFRKHSRAGGHQKLPLPTHRSRRSSSTKR
ncbi:MAG: hypothetical protein GY943_00070 [Chloroflexi bacterium]|nr:hypothetical protein [Chloroflexota bacterium]